MKMAGGHISWVVLYKKTLLLILLCGVIGCVVASQAASIQVAGPNPNNCSEHCVDVGAVEDETPADLEPNSLCNEHCVDVGALESGENYFSSLRL